MQHAISALSSSNLNEVSSRFIPSPDTGTDTGTDTSSACNFHQGVQKIFDADNADGISLLVDDRGKAAGRSTEPAQDDRGLIVRSHRQNTPNVISHRGDQRLVNNQIKNIDHPDDLAPWIHARDNGQTGSVAKGR